MEKKEKIIIGLCAIATIAAGTLHYTHANAVLAFTVTAGALALLAVIVGDATEQLGSRLGPGATGVLQSALGNLPELFVAIFALRAGLDHVVQAALIGSILGNSVLVLGLALFLGGLKNGTQRFNSEPPKMIVDPDAARRGRSGRADARQGTAHARRAAYTEPRHFSRDRSARSARGDHLFLDQRRPGGRSAIRAKSGIPNGR